MQMLSDICKRWQVVQFAVDKVELVRKLKNKKFLHRLQMGVISVVSATLLITYNILWFFPIMNQTLQARCILLSHASLGYHIR